MTHRLIHIVGTQFREARLLHFSGAGPDVPGSAEAPQPVVDVDKQKDIHGKAAERIKGIKEKMDTLQKRLDALKKFQADANKPGASIDQDAANKLGVKDVDADSDIDHADIDAAKSGLQAEVDTHQKDIDAARQEMAASVGAIEQSGPGGKLDAAMVQLTNSMQGGGSFGEAITAFATVMKELHDMFKGIVSPSASGTGGPEAGKPSVADDRATVKTMLDDAQAKDPAIDTLTKLKDAKKKELDDPVTGARKKVKQANDALTAANTDVATAKGELSAAERTEPKDEAVVNAKKVQVTQAEALVKVCEENLKSADAQVVKLEGEVKKIAEVEKQGKDTVDIFNAKRGELTARLLTMFNMAAGTPDIQESIRVVHSALMNNDAKAGVNGIDLEFQLPNTLNAVEFQKAFSDQGIMNTAEFGINRDTRIIKNPDALFKGIEQLLAKVNAKVTPPKPKS